MVLLLKTNFSHIIFIYLYIWVFLIKVIFVCRYLLTHQHDVEVNSIIERVRIHLIPSINPDMIADVPDPIDQEKCISNIDTKNINGVELDREFIINGNLSF